MPGLRAFGAPLLELFSEGTLTADGTEQTVAELTVLSSLDGWIDLSNMAGGDTVVIKAYAKIKSGGTYRQYASATYTGVQSSPALHITELSAKYGLKVSLQQTGGINRTYDYCFQRRR